MAFVQPWFEVSFGRRFTGLLTVGYRLYKNDGNDSVARTTLNVVEVGGGGYGVPNVNVPNDAAGIEWDTGGAIVRYAHEDIDPFRSREEMPDDIDTELTLNHGAGSWQTATIAASAVAYEVWSEALPGAYGAGEAGNIVGNNLDTNVGSRAAPGDQMDLINDAVDSNSLADSAVQEIDAELTLNHGAGSWQSATVTPSAVAYSVWSELLPGAYNIGEAGNIVGTNLDDTISSRLGLTRFNSMTVAAESTAQVGSTATNIQTLFVQLDDFFNNMQVIVINAAGTAVRNINDYNQLNGEIIVDALPFVPAFNDPVIVLSRTGSVPLDVAAIDAELTLNHGAGSWQSATVMPSAVAYAVWSEGLPGSYNIGEAGNIGGNNLDTTVGSRAAPGDQMDLINDAVDANSLANSAVQEIDTELTLNHGAGSWQSATVSASGIAYAVWNEPLPGAYAIGAAGNIVGTNLDTNVGSRSVPGDQMDLVNDAVDANSLANSAVQEIDTELTLQHGAGSWQSATVSASGIAYAVWSEPLPGAYNIGEAGNIVGSNLDTNVGSRAIPGDEMALVDDAITNDKYDEATAYPLESVDSGATQVARTGADGDTLKTLSDQIDGTAVPGDEMNLVDNAITSAKYDEITAFPVKFDDSGNTLIARTGADGDTLETLSDQIDGTAVPGDEMNLVDDAITSDKYDETTAFPLESVDSGSTEVARTGADGDTLETISDQIDGIPAAVSTDVWSEALPGAFAAGEAGKIVGDNVDATISSRAVPGDAMDLVTDAVDADALATSAMAELNTYLEVTAGHGAGPWTSASAVDWTTAEKEQIRDALGVDGTKNTAVGGQVQDIEDKIDIIDTNVDTVVADVATIKIDVAFLKQLESGNWEILNNQMIFYDTDGVTPLRTYNLFNRLGVPADVDTYKREKV